MATPDASAPAADAEASPLHAVLQLSEPDEARQVQACQTLMRQLQMGEVSAAQLLQLDCVPPLLRIVQGEDAAAAAVTAASATSASASTATLPPPLVLAARRVLHQLQMDAQLRLFDAGWNVSSDKATGRVTYRNAATKEERHMPPPLPATATDGKDAAGAGDAAAESEAEWVSSLLVELPVLCAPVRRADGRSQWAAVVRHHRPRSLSGANPALSVIDVRPEAEGSSSSTGAADEDDDSTSAEGVSRQLILGTWQGIGCAFRETEADLSYAPGTHLEAWYTVTCAGMALLAAAAADVEPQLQQPSHASQLAARSAPSAATPASSPAPKRVLVLGLGGGALVSFLSLYAPHWTVDVVELSDEVAHVAEQFFGVRFTNSRLLRQGAPAAAVKEDDAAPPTPPELATAAGFATPSEGTPCTLHVCDASDFVRAASTGSFDLVLLDVYTSGVFPPALLTHDFFAHLRRLLQRGAGTGADVGADGGMADACTGTLLVNAGVGSDRARVWELAREAFGASRCRMLLDRKSASAAGAVADTAGPNAAAASAASASASANALEVDAQENGVLLAGSVASPSLFRSSFNVVAWRKRVVERHPALLPPLPFEMHSLRSGDTVQQVAEAASDAPAPPSDAQTQSSHAYAHVAWRGVQLDKLAARMQRQEERAQSNAAKAAAAKAKARVMASKDDAAWSLFD